VLRRIALALVLIAPNAILAQQARPPERSGSEAAATPEKGDAGDAVARAATRPLRDLNIVKPKIAPDLVEIMENPYDIKGLRSCRQLATEVRRMSALVGPDVDDPELANHRERSPAELLLDNAEGITGSLIPGQGLIRQLTGANKAARQAAGARLAGQLRRAHVRGVMKARGCRLPPPPAKAAS
jgi:hypothetical protein